MVPVHATCAGSRARGVSPEENCQDSALGSTETDTGQAETAAVVYGARNAKHRALSSGKCGSLHRVQQGSDGMSSEFMEDSLNKEGADDRTWLSGALCSNPGKKGEGWTKSMAVG